MSWCDGLFKLSINLAHKKELNYINEFGSRTDADRVETKSRRRPQKSGLIQNQNIQSSLMVCNEYLYITVNKNVIPKETPPINDEMLLNGF